jgi:hypothetical protein
MINFFINNTKSIIFGLVFFYSISLFAHPMPNSVIVIDVQSKIINCQLQLPLKEMQLAVPFDITKNTTNLLKNHQQDIAKYILSHFSIQGKDGGKLKMLIEKMSILKTEQEATGNYDNLIVNLIINSENNSVRQFTINYDAIMHQVLNHKAIVYIRQDWDNGIIGEANTQIGTINIDINTLKVIPFKVNLSKGSNWKGFVSMVKLGMKHIFEGIDHLLFLLVLLLSAPLISIDNKWIGSGSTKYALIRILKIVTAFTIGHSITLIIGSYVLVSQNTKLVEMLIALSILLTAIHLIKPIFSNKETYVASTFGLVHGLSFATILNELNLDSSKLIFSLLGFNIGIELMQFFVIIIIMPWLLILSSYRIYKWVRIFGASLAGIASIAWFTERYTEKSNFISECLQNSSKYGVWLVFGLACTTIFYVVIFKSVKK